RRLGRAIRRNWIAFVFIRTFPYHSSSDFSDLEIGSPICETETREVLGFWRDDGHILCLVVRPEAQNIKKAFCNGRECCGAKTGCQPSVFTSKKYLIYCDAFYWKNDSPVLPAITTAPDEMNTDDFDMDVMDNDPNKREVVNWAGYFAFRHDVFPLTCSCRRCGSCSS
ncbi:uncharacterized protein LOC110455958, partial [Mizuhopecten yessoensis]|uniref:uncharacterized protein LOC110455958 n=1 Tax=Mizuhopecten yessoensis TaxID=6573 RepID=UPI000B45AA87